ncbi:MAG: hypothetical protein Q4A29_01990 [Eubacteriales bacterium]|nr:hypothetical protein [Eubacteriales bacterium]
MKKINLALFAVLSVFAAYCFSSAAIAQQDEKAYIYDRGNHLSPEQKAELNELAQNAAKISFKEMILVYSEEPSLPAEDMMIDEIIALSEQNDYGRLKGNLAPTLFLFVNQDEKGHFTTYVNSKFSAEYGEKNYIHVDMQMRIEEELNFSKDIQKAFQMAIDLDLDYLYPVVTDVSKELISKAAIHNASYELTEWEVQKNQRIAVLWKSHLKEELTEDYLDNFYDAALYRRDRDGVFILCSDEAKYLEIRFYGNLQNKYTDEDIKELKATLNQHREKHELEEMIHSLERFLDPKESVPLVKRDFEEPPKMPHTEIKIDSNEGKEILESINWGRLVMQAMILGFCLMVGIVLLIFIVIFVERRRQRKKDIKK